MKHLLSALIFFVSAFSLYAQDIIINPDFGNNGFITRTPEKNENILHEMAKSVIELPDGKLLLSIECNGQAQLTRYLPNGTLDKTFGTRGYTTTIRGYEPHIVRTDAGKILVASAYMLARPVFVITCFNEDGTLDNSFNNFGFKIIETGAAQNELRSFKLQKDGKLVLGGRLFYTDRKQAFVMRLLADGTKDTSFANEGTLKVDAPGANIVSGLDIDDTSIIVGAGNDNNSETDFVVLKYLLNGLPDTSFGDHGAARINIGTSVFLETVELQSDGKIIAAGEAGDIFYNRENFVVLRLLADGKPDHSFNQTGVATTSFGRSTHTLRALLPGANGKIMVGGAMQGNGTALVFARFNEDGVLDMTFGEQGKKLWDMSQVAIDINSGLLKKDGSFIGVGFLFRFMVPNNTLDYMLIHLNAAGQPNETFGINGVVTASILTKSSYFEQPKLVADGKLLTQYGGSANPWLQGIMRYLPDGSADQSFADKGFLKTNSYLFDELTNKRLVTFENIYDNTTYTSRVVMIRYTAEGQPDYTLGDKGQKVLPLYSSTWINAIKILPDGKILITGFYTNEVYQQQGFMVRLDKEGDLDKQFGEQGYVLFNRNRNEYVQQPMLQPDGKILVTGFYSSPPTYSSHFFVRRFTAAGLLDESFGNRGVIDGPYGLSSSLNRMLIQPDGKLLVLYSTTADNVQYESILQRYNQNGSPDESFGEQGLLKIAANGLELLKTGKLLLATTTISQGKQTGTLMLLNPNGSTDQSFGVNGTKVFRYRTNDASFNGLSVKDDKVYVSGVRLMGFDREGFLESFHMLEAPPGNGAVSGFTLVSTSSGKDIAELKENAVIDLSGVPTGGLNIRANIISENVGSVVLELQGPKSKTSIEDSFPYALFGDNQNGMYYGGPLPSGKCTLTATPYSKAGGKGTAGTPAFIHFKVVYPAAVTSFKLVDATEGKELREIREGDVLDITSLPSRFNIRAYTNPDSVGSVIFDLSSTKTYNHIESVAPYSLFGDRNGTYLSGQLLPGDYTLSGKPRSESKGAGGNGTSLIVHFKVVDPSVVHLLYGLTSDGGSNNTGTLFSLNTVNAKYNRLKDIGGADGKNTNGSLTQGTDGKLYGMTLRGGILPYGSIFSFDPKTNTFTSLQEFNHTNGADPVGKLVQASNGKLYGMTYSGGAGLGNIFSFDPAVNTITSLKEFNDNDGLVPRGSLVQASNGLLYGMTYMGGSNSFGVIFSFDPETSEYKKLQDLNGENAAFPSGSLMQASDGKLYGMASSGGFGGTIFSFDPVSNTLTPGKYFNGTDGQYPLGDLVQAKNGKLYGMTYFGGNNQLGVLFSFDAVENVYVKLLDFNGTNGSHPLGSLMQASDGKLYGETTFGGSSGVGIVFSFDPATNTFAKLKDFSWQDGTYPSNLIELSCTGTIYYRDADGDGYGDPGNTMVECYSMMPDGYVTKKGDCDDANAAVHPGALEICNGIDDNCDGVVDEGCKMGRSSILANSEKTISIPEDSKELRLSASPSPFSTETMIRFSVPGSGYVSLQVYDLGGKVVANLFQGIAKGGKAYQTSFAGKGLPGGVYLLRLTTANQTITSKVMKIR